MGRAFVDLFGGTELDVAEAPDFTTALWRKLCITGKRHDLRSSRRNRRGGGQSSPMIATR
jgi:hypothetical protein